MLQKRFQNTITFKIKKTKIISVILKKKKKKHEKSNKKKLLKLFWDIFLSKYSE